MPKWVVTGGLSVDGIYGTFSVNLEADNLRKAVESVETSVKGSVVSTITKVNPPNYRD